MVSFTDSSAMIIMNDLVRCFRDQLTFARKTNEPLRELTVREGIRIPEGLATLSNRQLNAVMANARFHCRFDSGQTQTRLNARGGASKDVAGTMADPAGDRGYSQSYADARYSAPPAPCNNTSFPDASSVPELMTPPKDQPPTKDPGSYLSERPC